VHFRQFSISTICLKQIIGIHIVGTPKLMNEMQKNA